MLLWFTFYWQRGQTSILSQLVHESLDSVDLYYIAFWSSLFLSEKSLTYIFALCFSLLNLFQTLPRMLEEFTTHNINDTNELWHNDGLIFFCHPTVFKLKVFKHCKLLCFCFHGAFFYFIHIVLSDVSTSVRVPRYHFWVVMVCSVVRAITYMWSWDGVFSFVYL